MAQHPPEVTDRESAVRFVGWCVARLGLAYHPDTPFGDYVDGKGHATFDPAEALRLDDRTERAFAFCDVYAVALEECRRLAPDLFEQAEEP